MILFSTTVDHLGIKCGEGVGNSFPAVFTRVSSYLPWIFDRTGDAAWCRRPQPEPEAGQSRGSYRVGQIPGVGLIRGLAKVG